MQFSSYFLFFFGALGVFNSFLISLYFLLFNKQRKISNFLFGFFLLFLSERAFRALIYFFSTAVPNDYSKFGPITFLFIGPFLYFYVLSVLDPTSKKVSFWKYHVLFWCIVAVAIHFIYPFRSDPIFWKKYILTTINFQWLVYIVCSIWLLYKYTSKIATSKKYTPTSLWIALLLLSVIILWNIYFFISYSYFIVGSIVFSVLFYAFFLFFIFKKKQRTLIFIGEQKYAAKKIEPSTAQELVEKLEVLMQSKKLYLNPNLKSSDVSGALKISTHQFSQLLNDNLKKSFSVYINHYRIEEAKRLIKSNSKYTLEAIGNESGFNSKSTFYTTFKRIVGVTPSTYKEQL